MMSGDQDTLETADMTPHAILLAAGRGTRIHSDGPKVLLKVAGRPMITWIVDACLEAGVGRCIIVVGPDQTDAVAGALDPSLPCTFVVQKQRLGTAHAAQMAKPVCGEHRGDVFVLAGDGPLIRASTLRHLHAVHREREAAATLATAVLPDPEGYGRILRDAGGEFNRIVEQGDATAEQRQVREVNPSYYCFRAAALFEALEAIEPRNEQGEYYLTDVPSMLKAQGHTIGLVKAIAAEDALSINTPEQLAVVDAVLRKRLESTTTAGGAR